MGFQFEKIWIPGTFPTTEIITELKFQKIEYERETYRPQTRIPRQK